MDNRTNSLNWFEIPVSDLGRAKKFYETIFGITMPEMETMQFKMAFFPSDPGSGKVSGGLCKSDMHKPSAEGAVIYLNADPDLSTVLSKIEAAGGKVVMPKTQISPDVGFMAFFADTEGNHVALHSQK
jgi:predicted enzyme related to lactoylglutathione lyase